MRRLWLLVLPWAVLTSTYQAQCVQTPTADGMAEDCATKTATHIAYNGVSLICCGDVDSSCMTQPPCDWMQDVTAAFNEMANARRAASGEKQFEATPADNVETPEEENNAESH